MPAVRKAKREIIKAGRAAGNWVKRLFPKYLGAPDEEDDIPEEDDDSQNPLFKVDTSSDSDNCNPESLLGCSYKQKFYIDKQGKLTAEKRAAELTRLKGMLTV